MTAAESESLFNEMAKSITDLDSARALELADTALNQKIDLNEAIESGFGKGIRQAGEFWDQGVFFLPELMMSAEIMKRVTDKLLPHLSSTDSNSGHAEKIVIGTVQGDIHDIGKTLVATLLQADGFEVIDLGADVQLEKFVECAKKESAHMICLSALLTTTMTGQKKVIELLNNKGLKEKVLVMVGGAPVNSRWAEEIGADGFASSAVGAVSKARSLFES